KGLAAMGARIELEHGYVSARARRPGGATLVFDVVPVTGTGNLMKAAAAAGRRHKPACPGCAPGVGEPGRGGDNVGGRRRGAGRALITIEGVDELQPIEHAVIPDRIEAGTLLVAAAITRGDVLVRECLPEHLDAVIAKLRAAGAEVVAEGDGVRVRGKSEFR